MWKSDIKLLILTGILKRNFLCLVKVWPLCIPLLNQIIFKSFQNTNSAAIFTLKAVTTGIDSPLIYLAYILKVAMKAPESCLLEMLSNGNAGWACFWVIRQMISLRPH